MKREGRRSMERDLARSSMEPASWNIREDSRAKSQKDLASMVMRGAVDWKGNSRKISVPVPASSPEDLTDAGKGGENPVDGADGVRAEGQLTDLADGHRGLILVLLPVAELLKNGHSEDSETAHEKTAFRPLSPLT